MRRHAKLLLIDVVFKVMNGDCMSAGCRSMKVVMLYAKGRD